MTGLSSVQMRALLIAAGVAVLVAVLGALATDIGPWYRQLRQPPWRPPDWLFGPAWTVIYACAALAAFWAWVDAPTVKQRDGAVALFALNALLNVLWSLLFFRLRRPDWALWEVAALWLSIALLIAFCGQWSIRATLLLLPYLLWVAFAATLNYSIVRLNAPFPGR